MRPLLAKLRGIRGEFGRLCVRCRQIMGRQREFLVADEMQALQHSVGVRLAERIEGVPQRQKVQSGAKTGLGDDAQLAGVIGKTRRKMIAIEKNMTRFQQAVLIGKIDVIKMSGNRCTLFVPA